MAKGVTVKILGAKDLKKVFDGLPRRAQRAMGAASYKASVEIMKMSKGLVPKDLGTLKGSGYVTVPRGRADKLVEMGYGGPAAKYAVRQHEDTSLSHPNGGQAKFLEAAVNRSASSTVAILSKVAWEQMDKKRGGIQQDPNMPDSPWSGRRD